MEHLRSEVREFLRFLEADRRHDTSVRHLARIGGQDAGHIGPDLDLVGVERGSEQRGAVIGPATSKRGGGAVRGEPDETAHHHRQPLIEQRAHDPLGRFAGAIAIGSGGAVPTIGGDHLIGKNVGRPGSA